MFLLRTQDKIFLKLAIDNKNVARRSGFRLRPCRRLANFRARARAFAFGSKRQGIAATENIYWRSHIAKRKNVPVIPKCYPKYDIRNTRYTIRTPSHGDLAIDYLLFTIDYRFPSWLSVPFVAEQRTPSHGDLSGISPPFCV